MVEKGAPTNSREAIISEIESWKMNPPEGFTWHIKLNNFHSYLPADDYSSKGGRQIGYMALLGGLLDIKNSEFHQDTPQRLHHSKLFLDQTPREFFEEIDKTIDSTSGVSLAEIKKLQRLHYRHCHIVMYQNMSPEDEKRENKKLDKSMKILKKLYEYALPIYIELRVRGYSHYDLTA